ncbi:MAG: phytoene/squalene synthase family protein [Actinobacteria bacterium]|nr:phytoene/squalene synthase family protein [Actinomycetota bacterium]NCX75541.1 phytoene/squalene synthase family protein [Actinomycetota bacterium]
MDELEAAGIKEEALRQSYLECKRLNSQHGKTYFLATLLLPKNKRPFVHALYGFARYADEIVDDLDSKLSPQEKRAELERWSYQLLQDIKAGRSSDHIGRALVDTVKRFDIPIAYFEAFLHSMAMDLDKTEYATFDELMEYVYGSAAVIGLQMLPILGTIPGKFNESKIAAEKLGIAFQLANFIRDVNEDLDRGRVYLPKNELAKFGVDRAMLERRTLTPEIIAALKFQIDRVRKLQRESDEGIAFLSPESRPCIQAASELYCGIVDEVEKIEYEIFKRRAKTSMLRRMKVALPAWVRAINAR